MNKKNKFKKSLKYWGVIAYYHANYEFFIVKTINTLNILYFETIKVIYIKQVTLSFDKEISFKKSDKISCNVKK